MSDDDSVKFNPERLSDILKDADTHPRLHKLKIWPVFFAQVISGAKRYEVRLSDRAFWVGDIVRLEEWDPAKEAYTGSWAVCKITCITNSTDWEMIPNHLSIFGFTVHETVQTHDQGLTFHRFRQT